MPVFRKTDSIYANHTAARKAPPRFLDQAWDRTRLGDVQVMIKPTAPIPVQVTAMPRRKLETYFDVTLRGWRKRDVPHADHHRERHSDKRRESPVPPAPLTGGKSGHYQIELVAENVGQPGKTLVTFDCNDIIEALNMTFAEGEVLKATWRKAAARQGNGKPGHQPLYDAQKIEFFGQRMVRYHAKKE